MNMPSFPIILNSQTSVCNICEKDYESQETRHIVEKMLGMRSTIAFQYATIISLLLLINAYYFDSIAVAQRTTPRSNETQSLDEESTSATSKSQNLNSEVTNTPSHPSQLSSKLGSSGEDLMSGTPSNDLILGLQGADSIRGNGLMMCQR